MKIVFATNNTHKLDEVLQILGDGFEIVTLREVGIEQDIPEEQDTLEGNALQKARFVYNKTGLDCFADDTGLEVVALDGAPGVFSARYAGPGNNSAANIEKLLHQMQGENDRRARFRTVIALILGGKEHLFEGEIWGEITTDTGGTGGFGYDSIFKPDDSDLTFAQMPTGIKNTISHRALAVRKFADHLLISK